MFSIVFRVNFCCVQLRSLSNLEMAVKKCLGNKLQRSRENFGLDELGADSSEN